MAARPQLAARATVVFNGIAPVVRPPIAAIATFRAAVGAHEGDIVVTLAGRLNQWKGQSLLIDAAAVLRGRGQIENVRFAIVGDTVPGQEAIKERLVAQVKAAGLQSRFSFVPFVDDILPVWFGSQIAVVPSTEPEPFGMVAIEAMAASVPVVAAAHGGLLDIIEHQTSGLLFEPRSAAALATAIETLVKDAGLRKTLGEAGARRQMALFSLDSQVERTESVYLEMAESP